MRLCRTDVQSADCALQSVPLMYRNCYDMKKYTFDITIIGAGPAGSMAAKRAAEKGASVLLIEKDKYAGIPVRCAEGVYRDEITRLVDIDDSWICSKIIFSELVSPDGNRVRAAEDASGFILDRKKFDQALAILSVESGADLRTETYASGMKKNVHGEWEVSACTRGEDIKIFTKVVIGADGVESRVGRWAGIDTSLKLREIESCCQFTLADLNIDDQTVQFYMSKEFAPGGYAWVFPKSGGLANVGLGILGTYVKDVNPEKSLKNFVKRYFPEGRVISQIAGGVPVLPGLKDMVADGVLLAGDAARQVDPLSGGGITNSMAAGIMAAEHAVRSIEQKDTSKKNLTAYQKEWDRKFGKKMRLSSKLKKVVDDLDEEVFNNLVGKMSLLPQQKRTPFAFFKTLLLNQPKLFLDVAKFIL